MLGKILFEIGNTLGLGDSIEVLAKELLLKIFDPISGGLPAFADKIEFISGSGYSDYLAAFNDEQARMPENDVTQLLGREAIAKISSACSISNASVIAASSALLPKLLKLISPQGTIPSNIPPPISEFFPGLSKLTQLQNSNLSSEISKENSSFTSSDIAKSSSAMRHSSWIIPTLVLFILAWFGWNWLNKSSLKSIKTLSAINEIANEKAEKAIDDSARAALAPQALQPKSLQLGSDMTKSIPGSLVIKNASGKLSYSGVVAGQEDKDAIESALNDIFGIPNVKGELLIDERATSPNWIGKLNDLLLVLRVPGLHVSMHGDSIKIGGPIPKADMNSLMLKVKDTLGQGFSIAAELDTEKQ